MSGLYDYTSWCCLMTKCEGRSGYIAYHRPSQFDIFFMNPAALLLLNFSCDAPFIVPFMASVVDPDLSGETPMNIGTLLRCNNSIQQLLH